MSEDILTTDLIKEDVLEWRREVHKAMWPGIMRKIGQHKKADSATSKMLLFVWSFVAEQTNTESVMCCLCEVLWLSEQTPSLWCVVYVKFCGWANKHRVCDVLFMWSFVAERTNTESVMCCLCEVLWLSEQTSSLWCVVYVKFCGWANVVYVKFCGWANKHRVCYMLFV